MTLVGLGVICIFKCKRHYKSHDDGEDVGWRITANYGKISLPLDEFMFVVLFMYIPCSKLTN